MKIKIFKGKVHMNYTWTCSYCGCRVTECYDDPWRCPDCHK
ncbi:hypothetical protein [Clostridium tagluense]|uniref:Rubredoxin-like domain-containing protein n=1 Tax=Clostridium tagluense TaxID=360422 RepID=A0A401UQE4_9CLOT|nr:hypothetical protein [Clostridium tagluense]GCD11740.1 hypothetical protein Ctaglu_33630 [Clostridium tagluense]